MVEIAILSIILAGLFGLGYYLGHQLGRTTHIRDDLRRARESHVIVRIEKQP